MAILMIILTISRNRRITMVLSEKKAGFDPTCHLQARSTDPSHSTIHYSILLWTITAQCTTVTQCALQLKCTTSPSNSNAARRCSDGSCSRVSKCEVLTRAPSQFATIAFHTLELATLVLKAFSKTYNTLTKFSREVQRLYRFSLKFIKNTSAFVGME